MASDSVIVGATAADGQPVTIREMGGEGRTVTLEGPDLPDRGIEAPLALREVTTRYPSGRTSVQMLGVEEEPVVLKCTFNDVLTGLGGGALNQVATLRSILCAQGLVELAWGTAIVRRGYLKRVTPSYRRESLIGCTIEFTPTEADETFYSTAPLQPVTASTALNLLDLVTRALSLLNTAASYSNAAQALF